MKMRLTVLLLTVLICLSGCAASGSTAAPAASVASTASAQAARDDVAIYGEAQEYEMAADVAEEAVYDDAAELPAPNPVSLDGKKIVYTVHLQMQTTEFEQGISKIKAVTEGMSGFIQNSYEEGKGIYDPYMNRSASFTLRVPAQQLNSFVDTMKQGFHVIREDRSSNDISGSYYDTESRLKALRTQEDLLLTMLEDSAELEYMLEVARELSNIRYEIESLTSAKSRMDADVSMSTVSIQLGEVLEYDQEVAPPTSFGVRLTQTARYAWIGFVDFLQGFVLFVVAALPAIILLAVIAVVAAMVFRRIQRRKKAEEESARAEQKQTPPDSGDKNAGM